MDRQKIGEQFYIDDHAALYGLLCRSAEERLGDRGISAAKEATVVYAKERGLRMAMRALANGDPLTPRNYLAYSEWYDSRRWALTQVVSVAPEYRFDMLRCGWNDSWKKYGLEKYGKIYCSLVDWGLAFGFNPELSLEMDMFLSHGHEKCNFHWVGVGFSDEADMNANMKKQAELRETTVKDFLYHSGHLLSAMKRAFYYEAGLIAGREIVDKALRDYSEIFGSGKAEAVAAEACQDFLSV